MKKAALTAALAAGCLTLTATGAAAWDKIGARTVTDRAERDVIRVKGQHRYERIKICVYKHPVRFYDVNVNFKNGGQQDVALRSRINAGECTRAIDLVGGNRDITSITLVYEETSRKRRKAKVKIFAE